MWTPYTRKKSGNLGRCENIDKTQSYQVNLKVIDIDKPTNISHVVLSTLETWGCKDFQGEKRRHRRAFIRWLVKHGRKYVRKAK